MSGERTMLASGKSDQVAEVCMWCGTGVTHSDDVLIALKPNGPRSHGLHEGRCARLYEEAAEAGEPLRRADRMVEALAEEFWCMRPDGGRHSWPHVAEMKAVDEALRNKARRFLEEWEVL